ncbi:MAG: sigma 54-interacting transcriptional regulator, partial [Eubacteriales bacterium]|nr:sigma 54-interacting transcriptional regulator [Eubacteriales bacterium]
MGSSLSQIQQTVAKYADIISQVAGVDVEVVDDGLRRVAGTGMFQGKVDQHIEGYIYGMVLRSGEPMVVYEPGRDPICQDCPNKGSCQEQIEISMPVRLDGQIIGVIGIVASTAAQKARIVQNEPLYMALLEQIADFIGSKSREKQKIEERDALIRVLHKTMAYIDQGVLILDENDSITASNAIARRQLAIPLLEGKQAQIRATGDHFAHRTEFSLTIDGMPFLVMGYLETLDGDMAGYARVLVFQNAQDVHARQYAATATVRGDDCGSIIGSSDKTRQLKEDILKIAQSRSTVLITGESGTGKEMVATAIWRASNRKDERFVAVNCAAIPEALLESELFGYVKGAFTGADPNGRIGKFELANHGMIFLDEIGDMPLFLQSKLLRVLQERKLSRIGSNQVISLDIRVIAATNKDLKEMIREKRFREDLYYRLNVIPLSLPPLRERREDIRELAEFFAKRYAELFEKYFWKFTDRAMHRLEHYAWEGNVRELENVVEFMVNMMGDDGVLNDSMLPVEFSAARSAPSPAPDEP